MTPILANPVEQEAYCLLWCEKAVRHKHVYVSQIAKIFPEGHPLGRSEVHQADQRYVRYQVRDENSSLGSSLVCK